MQEAIRKSDVLIEALPYIQSYSGKIFVIKYGGSALINPEIRKGVLQDVIFMSHVGIKPVIVHGGGPFINEELKRLGMKIRFHNGLRVTTKKDIDIVDRVLIDLNHKITEDINKLGGRAVSLNTGKKGIITVVRHGQHKKLYFVGEVKAIKSQAIKKVTRPRVIPVIAPLGLGPDGKLYNVNADDVSSEISVALNAAKLVLLTDVKGIMREKGNEETLITTLSMSETEKLIEEKIIQGGMIPKVKACTKAIKGGVAKTHIIDGRIPHSLLLEIFTDKGIGTEIVKTGLCSN